MNRRAFLRGVAGVTAGGVLLPTDEVVRRFWALDRTMVSDWFDSYAPIPGEFVIDGMRYPVCTGSGLNAFLADCFPVFTKSRIPIDWVGVDRAEHGGMLPLESMWAWSMALEPTDTPFLRELRYTIGG